MPAGRLPGGEPGGRRPGALAGWALWAWGAALGTANYFGFVFPLQYLSLATLPEDWGPLFCTRNLFEWQTAAEQVLVLGAVWVAAPVCEEVLFRGFFQERLARVLGPSWKVTALTALVFSAFHLDPMGFLARFELGLLFGLLYWRTGSLWPGVMAHVANNVTSTVLYLWLAAREEAGMDVESGMGPEELLLGPLIAAGLAVFAMLLSLAPGAGPAPGCPPRIGPFLAVSLRGIRLSLIDRRLPLPPASDVAGPPQQRILNVLLSFRAAARRGDTSLKSYKRLRQRATSLLRTRAE